MRPYHIDISWIDYRTTILDDMYEVVVWNATHNQIITTWQISGSKLGSSITEYMSKTE